jgi:hypothetical protein
MIVFRKFQYGNFALGWCKIVGLIIVLNLFGEGGYLRRSFDFGISLLIFTLTIRAVTDHGLKTRLGDSWDITG